MTSQPLQEREGDAPEEPQWKPPLAALQQALQDAANAVAELTLALGSPEDEPVRRQRQLVDAAAFATPDSAAAEDETARAAPHVPLDWTPAAPTFSAEALDGVPQGQSPMPDRLSAEQEDELQPEKSERLVDFQRVWARIEQQRSEQEEPAAGDQSPNAGEASDGARSLDLLPKEYLITVEDRDASVDLITIERALLTLAKMEDVTLVSYAKGVPVISLRVEGELDMGALGNAVGSAMNKRCEVIPQESGKIFLRLTALDIEEQAT